MQWPSYTCNCCAAWHFLHLLNTRDFMQVLQRTANPPALLCYFDCFILIAFWFWWEGVTPGEQQSLGTCTAWGAPARSPGLDCRLSVMWEEHSQLWVWNTVFWSPKHSLWICSIAQSQFHMLGCHLSMHLVGKSVMSQRKESQWGCICSSSVKGNPVAWKHTFPHMPPWPGTGMSASFWVGSLHL